MVTFAVDGARRLPEWEADWLSGYADSKPVRFGNGAADQLQLDIYGEVIDALHGGNDARWINHACEPNCEADEVDGRVFIHALRDLEPGEELFYDYGLVLDKRHTAKVKKQFACWCGALTCRGTMLAPKGR